ncbi:MAG: hypothetical protein IIX54_00720, partial [Clostridia bacterium]|nr:hypothetical protein [Clostridia bacterium]
ALILTTFAGVVSVNSFAELNSVEALKGKSVLVSGDSIAAGWRDTYKEKANLNVWDGTSKTKPSGDGTEDSPYIVSNGAELAWTVSNGKENEHYKLTADIYLNEPDKIDWSNGKVADGYSVRTWVSGTSFSGNLDGNGYTVYGIYYNAGLETSKMAGGFENSVGLIPNIPNEVDSTIKNIGVNKAYINAPSTASPFIGSVGNSSATDENRATVTVDMCYAGADVYVTSGAAGHFRGWSKNSAISIYNSYSLATVRSGADLNTFEAEQSWLIANGWNSEMIEVANCYTTVGSLYKGNWPTYNPRFSDCYSGGATLDQDGDGYFELVWYTANDGKRLAPENMQGLDVFTNNDKMPQLNSSGVYTATEGYPVLTVFTKENAENELFVGKDKSNGKGWGIRLEKEYGMDVTKAAVAGNSLTEIPKRKRIVNQLTKYKNNEYDYVLLEGGFNDAMGQNTVPAPVDNSEIAPYGEISKTYNVADFDTDTFAGALEEYFYYAKQYFPTAKIGYVVTYQTPQSQYGGRTADVAAMRVQWDLAKDICDKWDISYIDLFDGCNEAGISYSELFDVNNINSAFFPGKGDNIHLNTYGYDILTPYIAEWMLSLSVPTINSVASKEILTLDFETKYPAAEGSSAHYYSDNYCDNSSAKENYRGSYTSYYTEEDGNTAMNMSWDYENNLENYNANSAFKILNPSTYSNFVGEAGKNYTISFEYKVLDTDNKNLQFYIGYSGRAHLRSSDLNNNAAAMAQSGTYIPFIPVGNTITEETDGYVKVSVDFPAHGTYYPILILSCNGKVKDTTKTSTSTFASVLVDNLVVMEKSEISENEQSTIDYTLNFEGSYTTDFYKSNTNSSYANNRGSNAIGYSESDGNTAMHFTWDTDNSLENYNANAAINLYNTKTNSKFIGEAGKDYSISFEYKVLDADNKNLQFYVGYCGRTDLKNTDLNNNAAAMAQSGTYVPFIPVGDVITEETDGYVKLAVNFTAHGTYYPILILSCNGKVKDTTKTSTSTFASVLVDNIRVKETTNSTVKFYNYGGTGVHKEFTVTDIDTFGSIPTPSNRGFMFDGFCKDAGLTVPIEMSDYVGNYKNVYVKWIGGGNILSPGAITYKTTIGYMKAFSTGYGTHSFELQTNSMLEVPGANLVSNFYGSNVITSDNLVTGSTEQYFHDGLFINITTGVDEVIFYVEVPDYEKVGEDWALGLTGNGLCLKQIVNGNTVWIPLNFSAATNKFEYIKNNTWVEGAIGTDGHLAIPSGYKGYVKFDLKKLSWGKTLDYSSTYQLNQVQFTLNGFGGECGDFVFGGIFYAPSVKNEATVMQIENTCYDLCSNSDTITVNAYDVQGGTFGTRYQGTVGTTSAELTTGDTSAFFTNPAVITSTTGNVVTTKGYLNTYKLSNLDIVMQPAVDTLMFYVELPNFDSAYTALKLLDPTVKQGNNTATINFSNSIYEYMSVENGCWRVARAGADGELNAITSGFKGYIKVDLKSFKGFFDVTNINFSQIYEVSEFEIGFNHFGVESGNFILGGLYSVIADSNSYYITNGLTTEKLCARVFGGDFNCDGVVDWNEFATFREVLLGKELTGAAALRTDIFSNGSAPDITGLVYIRNCIMDISSPTTGDDVDNGVVYKNIFTENYSSNTTSTVYDKVKLDPTVDSSLYAGVIEADTELNYDSKAINFANEITAGMIGDFEKDGIDLMCHVSTFCYAKGNIYVTYYANTMSASENPDYQVARLAYAPEDRPEDKVILDIMLVGDDLYGQKVTGVYDTILMQKEDEPDNLYILWTASIQGKYYRLYRVFNMVTEELGEIGVNKFKVGDISNDFSDSGMKNALAENGIGYKETFSDIGIMQKLSTRVENGETYYYSGAYSGNFTCIIKSKDLITWEYVAQPNEGANNTGFENATKWENAVYVLGDKVYYFVRQWDATDAAGSAYGILTYYDLVTGEWAKPVLVGDCQSRSDFIYYKDNLYLFYAPTDRSHIGILRVDTDNLADSEVVLQAQMNTSCFYPFVQYNSDGELTMSYTISRKHIRLAKFNLNNYLGSEEDVPIIPDTEYSVLGDSLDLPISVQKGYHYGDPVVGDTIAIQANASWCCTSFKIATNNTYTVTFTSAGKTTVPYVYLCDKNGVVKQLIQANVASASNQITLTVTDESVTTVYIRSLSTSASSISAKQVINSNSTVDMNTMEQLKFEIVTPYMYSAWPMIGVAGDKLVCLYTVADQHSATTAGLYMKTSTTNGLTWTEGKEIFTDKTGVKGITGVGQDSKGNMLIWYRNGSPGAWQTTHELYKTDGRIVTQVSVPDFALRGGHIGNIFSVEDELFCFYNTYGNTRSWGLLKSEDDGLTWEQIPIEENVAKAECPVEIEGVYLGDGKILVLGRKDADEGTVAMFQMQSFDYGETWTKEYTNITDALGSSPSLILDEETGEVTLYFFARSVGQFKRRIVNAADVWNNPTNWTASEVLITEPYRGQDTGNVKAVLKDGLHFCTYYAGTSTTTGVYGVVINPSFGDGSESQKPTEKAIDVNIIKGYHYGDATAGGSVALTESTSWSCGDFDATFGKTYTVTFTTTWTISVPYIYLCNDEGVVIQNVPATVKSAENTITFTITDERITKVYVRSLDYAAGNIRATEKLGE